MFPVMKAALERLRDEALHAVQGCSDEAALEAVRVRYLGRKGELTNILRGLRDVPPEERPRLGELANELKVAFEQSLEAVRARLRQQELDRKLGQERIDVTLPGRRPALGHLHPLTQVMDHLVAT